jgi:hypothetical protein
MRTLLFGTVYIQDDEKFRQFKMWEKIVTSFGVDLLLVDSASPYFIDYDWKDWYVHKTEELDIFDYTIEHKKTVIAFPDNPGHLMYPPGRDSWGRSLCQALHTGVLSGCDRIVCIEADMLWLKPLDILIPEGDDRAISFYSIFNQMMLESGAMSFTPEVLKRTNFIERYDWKNSVITYLPELKIAQILGSDLLIYSKKLGGRIEDWGRMQMSLEEIASRIDEWYFITHLDIPLIEYFEKRILSSD